jgi:hypothetical protein
MATLEEKQELIETIKHPIRYYRLMLWGYGGESAYIKLDKATYEYWKKREQDGDETLLTYMLDEDREEVTDVPPEHDFMGDPDDLAGTRYSWHDAPNEIVHQWGVDYFSARLTVTEVESEEYNSEPVEDAVDGVELSNFVDEHEIEWVSGDYPAKEADYMLQFYSSEKGTFFEAIFATNGRFDPKKLKVYSTEHFNGDDTIDNIEYNGESLENQGGDTNGKGYTVSTWSNLKGN